MQVNAVSPQRVAALARLLGLLESARPADIPVVVAGLPSADVAAAIEAVQGRIPLPLREYILTKGSSPLLVALARQAVLDHGEEPRCIVDRVLLRFDPEADAAFFDFDNSATRAIHPHYTILRERKGPDGHAVIPPRVKQLFLDAIAGSGTEPDECLLYKVSQADDPDLVLALIPHAGKLAKREVARIIDTLYKHGRRAEVKRHRALWSGRIPSFTVLGFPCFPTLRFWRGYQNNFVPREDINLRAVSLDKYREIVDRDCTPRGYWRIREAARVALRAGTMTAAEVLEHTRPAALAVFLAGYNDADALPPGERRAADDVRILIARHAAELLADDPQRWADAVSWVISYRGSVLELLAAPGWARYDRFPEDLWSAIPTGIDAANILLAMAPRDVAARALATKDMQSTITALAGKAPLCRALAEHVVTHGTVPQRERLAANEATPDAFLARLLDRPEQSDVIFTIMDRKAVGRRILERAYAAAPRGRRLKDWIADHAGSAPDEALNALRCTSDDPEWLLSVLRVTLEQFDEPRRIAAYALLAEDAGMEAVWALELDRSGSLEAMAPCVRESMATGDAGPVIEAARISTVEDSEEPTFPSSVRSEEELDQPMARPLEDLIRTRLDGHTNRWLELADLLEARPEASDEELIACWPPDTR